MSGERVLTGKQLRQFHREKMTAKTVSVGIGAKIRQGGSLVDLRDTISPVGSPVEWQSPGRGSV